MNCGSELLPVAAAAGVGALRTRVPDHWPPMAPLARRRGWSKAETARTTAARRELAFACSTVVAYGLFRVFSATGLRALRPDNLDHYGQFLSGMCIVMVGLLLCIRPVLQGAAAFDDVD